MRNVSNGLLLVAIFILGCVASNVSDRVLSPPARAQPGANAQAWDYICFPSMDAEAIQTWGRKAGKQGWELAGAAGGATTDSMNRERTYGVWCFKRAIVSQAAPPPAAPPAQPEGATGDAPAAP